MRNLLRKLNVRSTLITGLVAGILFGIVVAIYISDSTYRDAWLLYIGSFMFLIVLFIHTYRNSQRKNHNESTIALVFSSHVATVVGILFSCIISFALLAIMVPGYLGPGNPTEVLSDEPANIIQDKTNGMSFTIFLAATIVNFSVGSFVSIILPFILKRNQTRDIRDPAPLHQGGVR